MTMTKSEPEPRCDLDDSPIAQLIECGLLARYGRDPEGLQWARQAVRDELLAKGWTLPPYTDAAHDFRHAAMHRMADWPDRGRAEKWCAAAGWGLMPDGAGSYAKHTSTVATYG